MDCAARAFYKPPELGAVSIRQLIKTEEKTVPDALMARNTGMKNAAHRVDLMQP
jgi:hypothetical protein